MEKDPIDHDPVIDGYLDRLPFAHVEGVSSVLTMVNARQRHKPLTTFEGRGLKQVDPLCPTEIQNDKPT